MELEQRLVALATSKEMADAGAAAAQTVLDGVEAELEQLREGREDGLGELGAALVAKSAEYDAVEARVLALSSQLVETADASASQLRSVEETLDATERRAGAAEAELVGGPVGAGGIAREVRGG